LASVLEAVTSLYKTLQPVNAEAGAGNARCTVYAGIIITDEYDLGGTVALLLRDHLTMLIVQPRDN